MPDEVFLSHSCDDQTVASSIAALLRDHGIPVWYSDIDIEGMQQWHDEIGSALRRCDFFCVLLSEASVESMWVKREMLYALQQRRFESAIAPVLREDCNYERLSWVLGSIQMIDFRDSAFDGCRALLRVWGKGLQPQIFDRHF